MDLSQFSSKNFDRGASRIKEALWILVRALFFLTPLPFPSFLRASLLRLFGAQVGHHVVIRSRVMIWMPWRLHLGDHVWIGEEAFLLNLAPIHIESSCCISQRAFLCTGSHDHRKVDFTFKNSPITLRTGSWIAAQAFVGAGVEIGKNAIVSAGSIALESVPENTIVRGNPATPCGTRYSS
ncbi:MAG: WcaF family extracellular polysaccharide biosynthesis acetyltransferase [Verrucomicrobiota bacterium]